MLFIVRTYFVLLSLNIVPCQMELNVIPIHYICSFSLYLKKSLLIIWCVPWWWWTQCINHCVKQFVRQWRIAVHQLGGEKLPADLLVIKWNWRGCILQSGFNGNANLEGKSMSHVEHDGNLKWYFFWNVVFIACLSIELFLK